MFAHIHVNVHDDNFFILYSILLVSFFIYLCSELIFYPLFLPKKGFIFIEEKVINV